MTVKSKILLQLKKADGYISGEQLSSALGVTRSAVWKNIKALKADGYEIDSVRNRGYRLLSIPDLLNKDEIMNNTKTGLVGKRLVVLDSVDSTNEEIKRLAAKGEESGTIVAAERQTAGKGRFGRVWTSENGGLYFTLLLRPELPPNDISSITLAAGYAVCLAVREYTGLEAMIKWPNDIIIGSKKICGILTEMAAQSDRIDYVAIGIGININHESFPDEIAHKATSLFLETGSKLDRNKFFSIVIECLDRVLEKFLVSLSTEDIKLFKKMCATLDRRVTIRKNGADISGIASDITTSGELIVTKEDGEKITVNSGEVTVQGIY